MTESEIVRILKKEGFFEEPAKRHRKFRNPDGRVTFIPRHKGDLKLGTLKAIEKQTGIKFT